MSANMRAAAEWYAKQGIPVFPVHSLVNGKCSCGKSDCISPGKHPRTEHGFEDATTDLVKIAEWWMRWPSANLAVPTGAKTNLLVIDQDPRNGGDESLETLFFEHGRLPDTAEAVTGGGGRHRFYRYSGGPVPKNLAQGIDLKGDGGYVLVAPSATKGQYEWDGIAGAKALLEPAEAPAWVLDYIHEKVNGNGNGKLAAPLPEMIPDGSKHHACVSLAGTMRRRGCGVEEITAALIALSKRFESPVPEGNLRKIAESACSSWQPDAKANIVRPRTEAVTAPPPPSGAGRLMDAALEVVQEKYYLLDHHHNDVGNAMRLIAHAGTSMRYCFAFKTWFIWDGRRWARDAGGLARRLAQETAIEFLRQAIDCGDTRGEKFAKQSMEHRRLSALLAEAEPHLAVAPDEMDTDPNVIAFLNGVADLRTGQLRPHQRENLITKLVPFNYNPAAQCPTFDAFLHRIMGATPDASEERLDRAVRLVAYLQTSLGYSLTGLTSEKAVFLVHGASGNNGKTTLLSLFLRLLPEHATLLQIETLMVRQESNNSQADLADLRGARYVMTSETEEGQRLAEGKLKRITQGQGKIKATRKYETPVEFRETHKLWLDCNHKPVIRGTDQAIWSRLHLIPFEEQIPDEEIDKDLPNKLCAEAEGILAWAVAGAVRWYNVGLERPQEVGEAANVWRAEMDQIGRFIDACCVLKPFIRTPAHQLYVAYRKWAEEAGERAMTETAFGLRMTERGVSKLSTNRGNQYDGLGLKADDHSAGRSQAQDS